MALLKKNYSELYKLQDKVLEAFAGHFGVFHLTGGTALDRFYLDHRNSEGLDLFANRSPDFKISAGRLRSILREQFNASDEKVVLYPDFIRVWVPGPVDLKVEMVNDVPERWGVPVLAGTVPVDTIGNILANKLTALVSRDEPKDVYDIVAISSQFSFNWADVFDYSVQKAIIAEADVLMRIRTFPVELFEDRDWLKSSIDLPLFRQKLDRIAGDFLLARDNSLGVGKIPIEKAMPYQFSLG